MLQSCCGILQPFEPPHLHVAAGAPARVPHLTRANASPVPQSHPQVVTSHNGAGAGSVRVGRARRNPLVLFSVLAGTLSIIPDLLAALAASMTDQTGDQPPGLCRFRRRTNRLYTCEIEPLLLLTDRSSSFQMVVFIEPFHRMFFINDLNISYPHAEVERVSVRK